MKGQSSIEYLSTYGWMLVTVAIVSGAIYSYIPQDTCNGEVTTELGNQLQIEDIAVDTQGDLNLQIRNMGAQDAYIENITLIHENNETSISPDKDLPKLEDAVFQLEGTTNSENCNTFNVDVDFNTSNLEDQTDAGELEAEARIE